MRGVVLATAAAIPFAVAAIAADVLVGFPQDINVAWPQAWLFYPTMAIVAETVLHLLPLAGLVWATGSRFVGREMGRRTWMVILAVALVGPIAQLALESTLPLFVLPHIYAIGVVQLILLRRYGYIPMIWFRVFYNMLWHVLSGEAPLALLF